jgi:hypothetical protein
VLPAVLAAAVVALLFVGSGIALTEKQRSDNNTVKAVTAMPFFFLFLPRVDDAEFLVCILVTDIIVMLLD